MIGGFNSEGQRIRPARLPDAAEIGRLAIELGYPASVLEVAARLQLMLAAESYFVAVAPGHGGVLLGWVAAERRVLLESGEKAEITGLVVSLAARRAGVGASLVAAAEQWAAGLGLKSICVRSNVARMESHGFYQAIDYMPRKTQQYYEKQLASI